MVPVTKMVSRDLVASVIWMRPSRGARGPARSRDHDDIVQIAVAIADREGISAVSMRRIATELGSGTSSLYRYFARKDDLLQLMVDRALGGTEAGAPIEATGDWRRDLVGLSHGMRALFKRHPWLGTALAGRPTPGPNRLRALESTLDLLASTGLALGERLVLIETLTSYVRGFVASEIADHAAIGESDLSTATWKAEQAEYLAWIGRSGSYPLSKALFDELASVPAGSVQDRGFSAGLELILDGIAQRLEQGTAASAAVD